MQKQLTASGRELFSQKILLICLTGFQVSFYKEISLYKLASTGSFYKVSIISRYNLWSTFQLTAKHNIEAVDTEPQGKGESLESSPKGEGKMSENK